MITVTTEFRIRRERAGRKRMAKSEVKRPESPDHVPRISRLMALAIKFQAMLRDGTVRDQSELARLAHVTQPRMTQILNLNFLAPDIQEALLNLPRMEMVKTPQTEKELREIVAAPVWSQQRRMWRELARSKGILAGS